MIDSNTAPASPTTPSPALPNEPPPPPLNDVSRGKYQPPAALPTRRADDANLGPFRAGVEIVPLRAIRQSALRMRREVDLRHVAALAKSLVRWGQLAPLIGRALPNGVGYELVAGLHRLEGLRMAKIDTAWMLVFPADTPDAIMELIGIESNLRCHGSNRFETFMALLRVEELDPTFGTSGKGSRHQRLAQAVGVDRSTASRGLKTISPAIREVRDAWRDGSITADEVEQLATLPPTDQPTALATAVARHRAATPTANAEAKEGDLTDEPKPPSLLDQNNLLRVELDALRAQLDSITASRSMGAPDVVPATALTMGNLMTAGADAEPVPSPTLEDLRKRLAAVVAAGAGLYHAAWVASVDTKRMGRWLKGGRPPKMGPSAIEDLTKWLFGAEQKLKAARANATLRQEQSLQNKSRGRLFTLVQSQGSDTKKAKGSRSTAR